MPDGRLTDRIATEYGRLVRGLSVTPTEGGEVVHQGESVLAHAAMGGGPPTESLALSYSRIKVDYFKTQQDGSLVGAGSYTYEPIL